MLVVRHVGPDDRSQRFCWTGLPFADPVQHLAPRCGLSDHELVCQPFAESPSLRIHDLAAQQTDKIQRRLRWYGQRGVVLLFLGQLPLSAARVPGPGDVPVLHQSGLCSGRKEGMRASCPCLHWDECSCAAGWVCDVMSSCRAWPDSAIAGSKRCEPHRGRLLCVDDLSPLKRRAAGLYAGLQLLQLCTRVQAVSAARAGLRGALPLTYPSRTRAARRLRS